MTKPSRHVRPDQALGMVLQPRDKDILLSLYLHRYLSAEHVRQLHFRTASLRAVQARLRKLWANHYLDRYLRPFSFTDSEEARRRASVPLYSLAKGGADIVAAEQYISIDDVPHTPRQNADGFSNLEHNLVATDLLVALQAACQDRPDVQVVVVERESALRRKNYLAWSNRIWTGESLTSDSSFSLGFPSLGVVWTFHIEVVRALVKAGNKTIKDKMRKYARLVRQGFFQQVLGHKVVRAVLFVTTSEARALRFCNLAASLAHGRGLFWFAAYQHRVDSGRVVSNFSPQTILALPWHGADGQVHSFIHPLLAQAPPTEVGAGEGNNISSHVCAQPLEQAPAESGQEPGHCRRNQFPEKEGTIRTLVRRPAQASMDTRQDRVRQVNTACESTRPGHGARTGLRAS